MVVLKNGGRGDVDVLPIKAVTGVAYASTAMVKDMSERDQSGMHRCARDAHLENLIGAARILDALRNRWKS